MVKSPSQSEIDTEVISRAAMRAAQMHREDCPHQTKWDILTARDDEHSSRIKAVEVKLTDGENRFQRLEMKLENVSEKLGELSDTIKGAVRWVLGAAGAALIGTVLWSIKNGAAS